MDNLNRLTPNNLSKVHDFMLDCEQSKIFSYGSGLRNEDYASYQESGRIKFINNDLETFYKKVVDFANNLTLDEISNIADKTNERRQLFDELFKELSNAGFSNIQGRYLGETPTIAFWSGEHAQKFMENANRIPTDLTVPTYAAMLCIAKEGMQENEKIRSLFMQALFTHYASNAVGKANVIISRPVVSGHQESFVTAHNYFWEVELPVLWKLKRENIVNAINLSFYDNVSGRTVKVVEISSPESDSIKILSRSTVEAKENKYKKPPMTTLGRIREIALKWKTLASIDTNPTSYLFTQPEVVVPKPVAIDPAVIKEQERLKDVRTRLEKITGPNMEKMSGRNAIRDLKIYVMLSRKSDEENIYRILGDIGLSETQLKAIKEYE